MNEAHPNPGDKVVVKIKGVPVSAVYLSWSDQYNLAVVDVEGKKLYRKLFSSDTPVLTPVEHAGSPGDPYGRVELRAGNYEIFDSAGRLKATLKAPNTPRPASCAHLDEVGSDLET